MKSDKVKDCTVNALENALREAMITIGISDSCLPKADETKNLLLNIRKYAKGETVKEIELAFEAVANRELFETKVVNGREMDELISIPGYVKFSYATYRRVMNAYQERIRAKAYKALNEMIDQRNKRPEPDQAEKELIRNEFIAECILPVVKKWNGKGMIDFGTVSRSLVWLTLKEIGYFKMSSDEKAFYETEALEMISDEIMRLEQTKALSRDERTRIKEGIESLQNPSREKIIKFAKRIQLNDLMRSWKMSEIDSLHKVLTP